MIPRECAASGAAKAVTRPARADDTPAQPEPVPATPPDPAAVWDDLYQALSPEQQRAFFALAERQGLLYAHQLPIDAQAEPSRKPLARILDGAVAELQPVHAEPIEVGDEELDPVQREAVAKALATPDIFLMQGRPGSGKSRVLAEIIARAAARGERVLLLAPTPAGIDRVLEWVVCRDFVFPVRCVDGDEKTAHLPASVRALTFNERVRSLGLQALSHARCQQQADEQRLQRLRQDEPLWVQLSELAAQAETLERECQEVARQRSRLAVEVAEEAQAATAAASADFPRRIWDLTQAYRQAEACAETRLAELRGRMEASGQSQAHLQLELRALQPLVEAKHQRRWWTAAWWRATLGGKKTLARWSQLQERLGQIQADLDAARQQLAGAARQWEEARNGFAAKRTELIAAELARRQAELDDRAAALGREQSILQQKWQNACQGLALHSLQPRAMTRQGVQAARSEWCRQKERVEAQSAFTRQWVTCLERTPEVLSACLPGYFNLVAATMTALARAEHFGQAASGAEFDLLLVEEADQVTEPELRRAICRARRCVLVGELAWPEPGVFQRLWQRLHCDPRQLPYAWSQEGGRLCCRLRQVTAEQRQWITSEAVADCPDIELRILAVPRCQPTLAEILFPPSFSLDRAKQYVFQELQELAVQASGSSLRWTDSGDRVVLRLADRDLAHGPAIDLAPGIREILGTAPGVGRRKTEGKPIPGAPTEFPTLPPRPPAVPWQTCCVEFDRSAGWDRARAAAWVREYLGLCDLGRTISLDVCYRMSANLAALVSQLLADDSGCADLTAVQGARELTRPDWQSVPSSVRGAERQTASPAFRIQAEARNGWSEEMEFVPVPALAQSAAEQGHANPGVGHGAVSVGRAPALASVLPRKGGAGFEIDLTDFRQRERLPAALRSDLPTQGFVNYQEAQAVVRTLAKLLKESGIHGGGTGATCPTSSSQPAIAVLALYPAQAELIRRLLKLDARLEALDGVVEVGVPAAFRQREAAIVLLSLTRSHTHRAVAFGEGPQMLALAMTRARAKLFVFGDPGTLLRRSNWQGPVEHLGPDAAARERRVITRLVHYLR